MFGKGVAHSDDYQTRDHPHVFVWDHLSVYNLINCMNLTLKTIVTKRNQALILYQMTKLKAFADNIIDVTQKLPAFSPFPTMFSEGFLYQVVKSHDCSANSQKINHTN